MTRKKQEPIPKDMNIIGVAIEDAMPENYLPYAIEVAKERALPDVRDGLKPVHRRILYGAYMLKAFPDRPYYKSARIVGDILGKYHPHGDSSVYESMVILAQDFSTRCPLIEGHGNWGSVDGDSAAAMRYTEARLSNIAMEMLRDIDKDTVDMVPNYSDSEMEPKVLPSRYPNLLVNGTFGIAVGLATNIPPHNLREVTDGVLAYIDNNNITTKELMNYVKGPDLPTGGILIGENSLLKAYETGEGKVACRAKTSIEKLENGRVGIVITEFPFRRNKSKILQTISEMTGDKKHAKVLEAITDIRDESDREGIRAVIEFKKSATEKDADKVLKYLFKKTDLQCNVIFNMVALAEGKPETMGLKTIIKHYVNHQKDIITRRTRRELETAEKRFHIVEGFIKAIDVLDEVIKVIRESKSKKDAQTNLIAVFDFTEPQAQAILELMLYRLTGLEIKVFEKEYKELEKLIKKLNKILSNEKELLKVIKNELKEIADKYGDDRRTQIIHDDNESKIELEDIIVVEDIMITLSNDGFIKRIPVKAYTRSNSDPAEIDYREGDYLKYLLESNTKDSVLIFTDLGNMYQARGINLPEAKWKDKGERIDNIIKTLDLSSENIINIMSVDKFDENLCLKFITDKGGIKLTSLDNFATNYSKYQAVKLKNDDKLLSVSIASENEGQQFLKIKTKNGLEFTIQEPELEKTSRVSNPVSIFEPAADDRIISAEKTEENKEFQINLGITAKHKLKSFNRVKEDDLNIKVSSSEDVIIFTNEGNAYKIPGFMLEKVQKAEVAVEKFTGALNKNEKIIKLLAVSSYNDDKKCIYTFTKNGLIKKTYLSEYEVLPMGSMIHKFKSDDDKLLSVICADDSENYIVLITKKGMVIKFESENINSGSKTGPGVKGINLNDDDELCTALCVKVSDKNFKLKLSSKADVKEELAVDSIKIQNRGSRGVSAIKMKSNDVINKIEK